LRLLVLGDGSRKLKYRSSHVLSKLETAMEFISRGLIRRSYPWPREALRARLLLAKASSSFSGRSQILAWVSLPASLQVVL
jgi:hypothetical protein